MGKGHHRLVHAVIGAVIFTTSCNETDFRGKTVDGAKDRTSGIPVESGPGGDNGTATLGQGGTGTAGPSGPGISADVDGGVTGPAGAGVDSGSSQLPSGGSGLESDGGLVRLLIPDPTNRIEYHGNRCPGSTQGCDEQDQQIAVDGFDLRNPGATGSLVPSSALTWLDQFKDRQAFVLTGIGAGATVWGTRILYIRVASAQLYDAGDVIEGEPCPQDRVPIGKPRVARTDQQNRLLCARLVPGVSLGASVTIPGTQRWDFGVAQECPEGHVLMGYWTPEPTWSMTCAPLLMQ